VEQVCERHVERLARGVLPHPLLPRPSAPLSQCSRNDRTPAAAGVLGEARSRTRTDDPFLTMKVWTQWRCSPLPDLARQTPARPAIRRYLRRAARGNARHTGVPEMFPGEQRIATALICESNDPQGQDVARPPPAPRSSQPVLLHPVARRPVTRRAAGREVYQPRGRGVSLSRESGSDVQSQFAASWTELAGTGFEWSPHCLTK
jgi:hypothetical protein